MLSRTYVIPAIAAGLMLLPPINAAPRAQDCSVGMWSRPGLSGMVEHATIISEASAGSVVLLGEFHDNAEHHRLQLSTIAGLLGQRRDIVLGFEAFPRRVQPVLDRWVAGELSEKDFLQKVDWWRVWGFDPDLYMPLLNFARLHRVPVIALNVDRSLVARVGDVGWEAIPEPERRGLGNPVEPDERYVTMLADSFLAHGNTESLSIDEVRNMSTFQRFVEAQLTWDRAMAEMIADSRLRPNLPLVVGIIGTGHLQYRYGVPHQLADLGIEDAIVLLPHDADESCVSLEPDYADAVFALADRETDDDIKPRLSVTLAERGEEVVVDNVQRNTVASAAGILVGDIILNAGGQPIRTVGEMVDVIRQQLPGTWLPIDIYRGEQVRQVVAKFPYTGQRS